jgi:imidazoleglycerol phosphate synthase glutamine amidotransferase subunit HisH
MVRLSAVIEQGRFYGMQFHPERSSRAGLRMLVNFLRVPS